MKRLAYCSLLFAVLAGPVAHAQPATPGEAALVKRAAELREQPGESSRSLGPLPPQTAVTRLPERSGAWVQVRTAQGAQGWLHIFDLTTPNAPSQGGSTATGALRGLTGLFNRGTGAGSTATTSTSTVGIRGLGAEDLRNSQPNLAAVSQAESLRQDAGQAQSFANAAQLQQRPLVVLPEPPRPASPSPSAAPGSNQGVLP
jgi:hypothetical protein